MDTHNGREMQSEKKKRKKKQNQIRIEMEYKMLYYVKIPLLRRLPLSLTLALLFRSMRE